LTAVDNFGTTGGVVSSYWMYIKFST